MNNELFTLIERFTNLLRNESRASGQAIKLQPIQHEALYYLTICNRYSNTPLAVTEFLGLTKGTVSQTLKILENRGLIKKQRDPKDKRVVHLILTQSAKGYIEQTIPPTHFDAAVKTLSPQEQQTLSKQLKQLLLHYQKLSGRNGFGVCQYCQYNQSHQGEFFCGLTKEALSTKDIELICREFTAKG